MQVNVRLYYNTGFNPIDAPANANVIETLATDYYDIPSIFVVQNRGLSSIRIPLSYERAVTIEYVRLTDTTQYNNVVYYMITSPPTMINEQDCELKIEEDFITTCNIQQSDLITGQINIAHVPVDDWRYAQIPEDRFTPPGILELKQQEIDSALINGGTENNNKESILLSTIDPVATAENEYAILNTGYAVLDPTHSGNVQVAVPKVEGPSTSFRSDFKVKRLSSVGTTITRDYYPPYYAYYFTSSSYNFLQTLDFIRSLGLFDSVLAMYDIPEDYIQTKTTSSVSGRRTLKVDNNSSNDKTYNLSEDCLTSIEPIFKYLNTDLNSIFNFEYSNGYTPRNKKVFAGDNNKYTLVSKCTGSKIEINPEDCMTLSNNVPQQTQPNIVITADLRANGSPKAFFRYMYNGANSGMIGVNGMSWANHQNNYFGQYGTEIANNQFRLGASKNLQNANFGQFQNVAKLVGDLAATVYSGGAGNMMAGAGLMSKGSAMAGSNMVYDSEAMSTFYRGQDLLNRGGQQSSQYLNNDTLGTVVDVFRNELNYRQQQASLDYANRMATGATKSPIIEFPFSESSREIFGNYFTIYRTVYTASQMKQMDDFYTMWGYKVGGIDINGESADWFNNRQYFNYISMSNVSVNLQDHPIYERLGIASQLASRRMWHILPKDWSISMGNPITS